MLQIFISLPKVQPFPTTNLIQSLRLVYTLLTEELLQDCNSYANRDGNKQSNHYNQCFQIKRLIAINRD